MERQLARVGMRSNTMVMEPVGRAARLLLTDGGTGVPTEVLGARVDLMRAGDGALEMTVGTTMENLIERMRIPMRVTMGSALRTLEMPRTVRLIPFETLGEVALAVAPIRVRHAMIGIEPRKVLPQGESPPTSLRIMTPAVGDEREVTKTTKTSTRVRIRTTETRTSGTGGRTVGFLRTIQARMRRVPTKEETLTSREFRRVAT